MTGARHRSNCELVAQGVANTASAFFGGLPATGAIARTATNIRSGARSPVAGILHAVFLLIFMLVAAPLMAYVPLASLAAVLVIVAWNMSEIDKFRHLMSAPMGDRLVLLVTFALTVLVDLTVAIQVGVVLGAVLFMHRMAEAVMVQKGVDFLQEDVDDALVPAPDFSHRALPEGVEMLSLRGPLFFGAAQAARRCAGRHDDPAAHLHPAHAQCADRRFDRRCRAVGFHAPLPDAGHSGDHVGIAPAAGGSAGKHAFRGGA